MSTSNDSEERDPVVALAGRRVDRPQASEVRFPLENAAAVRFRIAEEFARVKPAVLVCSAACGADLLALEVAGELGVRRRVVLPFAPDVFRRVSVVDRPGSWGLVYDEVIREVGARDDLILLNLREDDRTAYTAGNTSILREGTALGTTLGKNRLAYVVWDGLSRGAGDKTEQFRREAERCGFRVHSVSTL